MPPVKEKTPNECSYFVSLELWCNKNYYGSRSATTPRLFPGIAQIIFCSPTLHCTQRCALLYIRSPCLNEYCDFPPLMVSTRTVGRGLCVAAWAPCASLLQVFATKGLDLDYFLAILTITNTPVTWAFRRPFELIAYWLLKYLSMTQCCLLLFAGADTRNTVSRVLFVLRSVSP